MTHDVPAIQTTEDHDLFVFDRTNRKRNPKALAKLRRSVRRIGLRLDLFPVVVALVDGRLRVLDGQHRVMLAREMGLPVAYVVADGLTMADVSTVNQAQTAWGLNDHVRHHAEAGNENYARILGLMAEHDVSAYVATVALGISASGPLKSGEAAVSDADAGRASALLSRCADFSDEVDRYHWHPFVNAVRIVSALPGYDHGRMMMRAERYGVRKQPDQALYCRELLTVYNTRTPQELRLSHPRYGDGS